jgi:anti-sigma28 factor (negative regulator of flagellin synthesis)
MEQGQDEVRQVDRVMVAELKSAIEAGAFKVDIGALADRLLSDVFEQPGDVEASDGSNP